MVRGLSPGISSKMKDSGQISLILFEIVTCQSKVLWLPLILKRLVYFDIFFIAFSELDLGPIVAKIATFFLDFFLELTLRKLFGKCV